MRDPARIDAVLGELAAYWKRNPDLRLFQIFGNLAERLFDRTPESECALYLNHEPLVDGKIYVCEDERVLEALRMENRSQKA